MLFCPRFGRKEKKTPAYKPPWTRPQRLAVVLATCCRSNVRAPFLQIQAHTHIRTHTTRLRSSSYFATVMKMMITTSVCVCVCVCVCFTRETRAIISSKKVTKSELKNRLICVRRLITSRHTTLTHTHTHSY